MHQPFARCVQGSVGTMLDAAIRDHTSLSCTLARQHWYAHHKQQTDLLTWLPERWCLVIRDGAPTQPATIVTISFLENDQIKADETLRLH